jgi:outer membrane protein assembly factor BamA
VDVEFDGDEGEVRVRWDGLGARGTVRIPAGAGYWFPSLDIDPDRRTYQAQRGDDTLPRVPVKILVNRFSVRIDLNRGNRNEAAIGLTLHPAHDYAHSVTVDAFYEQDENGVDLGYGYGFGTRRDARSFGAGVGVGLTAATLSEGVLDTDETEGNLASVSAGASFDTRLVEANPTWGFKIGGGVEYTDRLFDTDFRFTRYRGSVSAIYSIIRGTQIAAKVVMGQIEGERVPSQRLFDVGGSGGVRGVETSTFVDTAVFAVRGEVRQMVVEDMDFSLLYLAWLRKIQVVAFMHTGDVGPTIEHIIRRDTEWKWGAGGGVRFYVDAFGVKKFVVSFDVGTRLFDDNGQDPQFYVGAGQSF